MYYNFHEYNHNKGTQKFHHRASIKLQIYTVTVKVILFITPFSSKLKINPTKSFVEKMIPVFENDELVLCNWCGLLISAIILNRNPLKM